MKLKTKVESIFCLIDLKQELVIDDKIAMDNGFKLMGSLNAFVFSSSKNSPEINFMIFPSGKIFLIGVKSEEDLEGSFWFLIRKLREIGVKFNIKADTEIEIQNVIATANLKDYFNDEKFEVNLEKLALGKNAEYDPKKFPCVFLRFFSSPKDKNNVPMLGTALVFRSGKILVGDVKSVGDADLILEKVIEKVK